MERTQILGATTSIDLSEQLSWNTINQIFLKTIKNCDNRDGKPPERKFRQLFCGDVRRGLGNPGLPGLTRGRARTDNNSATTPAGSSPALPAAVRPCLQLSGPACPACPARTAAAQKTDIYLRGSCAASFVFTGTAQNHR